MRGGGHFVFAFRGVPGGNVCFCVCVFDGGLMSRSFIGIDEKLVKEILFYRLLGSKRFQKEFKKPVFLKL